MQKRVIGKEILPNREGISPAVRVMQLFIPDTNTNTV